MRIVIIGAGISGLSAAFRLQQRMPLAEIQVLEQESRPGGTMGTLRRDGFQVEIGPNGFLDTKPTTVQLCRDVGLEASLVAGSEAASKNRYLFLGDKLHALPGGPMGLLTTSLLSWRGKLGFLLERFRSRRSDGVDESVDAFARRRAGNEVADVFADALVTGIHAGDPHLLSLAACFPRVADLERRFGSVLKGFGQAAKERRRAAKQSGQAYQRPGKMWSLPGGLGVLAETLAGQLRRPITYGVAVRRLRKENAAWVVEGDGKDAWHADAVLLTCPAHQQARIVADIDAELATMMSAIAFNRIAVVALGYKREDVPGGLDGFGFIAPQRLRRDLLGVQWCSSIYPDRAPPGHVLLRAMCGGWHRADMVSWDDDRLVSAVRRELLLAMRIERAPVFQHIVRWDRGIPQYHVGHLERVAAIEKRAATHAGLFLGGNSYHGVAMNDCTEQALILAERIAAWRAGSR